MASLVATTSLRTEEPVNPTTMNTLTVATPIVTVTTTVTTTTVAPTNVVGHPPELEIERGCKRQQGGG